VIEFNARFGDPETQVLVARMGDDLVNWCEAVAKGDLSKLPTRVPFKSESAVVVVGAARGYPEKPEKGRPIRGLGKYGESDEAPRCFIAGARREKDGAFVTSGGRVFGAMGMGSTLECAREQAYRHLEAVSFDGMQFRRDIGACT
jgi:phosphoribosylamine--glycine ligase